MMDVMLGGWVLSLSCSCSGMAAVPESMGHGGWICVWSSGVRSDPLAEGPHGHQVSHCKVCTLAVCCTPHHVQKFGVPSPPPPPPPLPPCSENNV